MKDNVIKILPEEKEKLCQGCNRLESNLVITESSLEQYRKHNEIVISGINSWLLMLLLTQVTLRPVIDLVSQIGKL